MNSDCNSPNIKMVKPYKDKTSASGMTHKHKKFTKKNPQNTQKCFFGI